MTGLRAVLVDLRLEAAAIPTRQVLPGNARRPTYLALQKILDGCIVAPAEPAADRLDRAWQHLKSIREAGGTPADLSPRNLGDLVWLLWVQGRRACNVPGLLPAIQIAAATRTRYLKRFVDAWLRDYTFEDAAMREAGVWLAAAVMQAAPSSLAVWQRAQTRHALFGSRAGSQNGPASVAEAVLVASSPPALQELGFDTATRGVSGYMRAVVHRLAEMLPGRLSGPAAGTALDRALPVFLLGKTLRFDEPTMRGLVADALVAAWDVGTPPDTARDRVLEFLLTHIGDPRTQPANWESASARTRGIVRGWLARVTLSAFFGIIGQFADAAGWEHQWETRRKFWSACLDKGWVSDSWLILGQNVRRHVARNRALVGSWGALDGYGVENHSALLMRIGGTVFAEWSHNGKLYAWSARSGKEPSFFLSAYAVDSLKSAGLHFPPPSDRPDMVTLHGPGLVHHTGTWRGRVAALLKQRENLRIEPQEWS